MSTRVKRVEELLGQTLRELFLFQVSDPRAKGIQLTTINMTPDLRLAHVNYILEGERDAKREADVAKALRKLSPFLRRQLTEKVLLKYSPELDFHYDEGFEKEQRIEKILHELENEA